jgi:hypothetical protein
MEAIVASSSLAPTRRASDQIQADREPPPGTRPGGLARHVECEISAVHLDCSRRAKPRHRTTGTTARDCATLDRALICGAGSETRKIDRKGVHAYSQVNETSGSFWCLRAFYFSHSWERIGGSARMPAVGRTLSGRVSC